MVGPHQYNTRCPHKYNTRYHGLVAKTAGFYLGNPSSNKKEVEFFQDVSYSSIKFKRMEAT